MDQQKVGFKEDCSKKDKMDEEGIVFEEFLPLDIDLGEPCQKIEKSDRDPLMRDIISETLIFTNTHNPEFFMFEAEDEWLFRDDSQIMAEQDGGNSQQIQQDTSQNSGLASEPVQSPYQTNSLSHASTGNYFEEDKDETKNVPKNFGKQIIRIVKKQAKLVKRMLESIGSDASYQELNQDLQRRKNKMNKIGNLRELWTENKFAKEMRVLSQYFLRKKSVHWIFNSRLTKRLPPLKYRMKLQKVLHNPQQFHHLKSQ